MIFQRLAIALACGLAGASELWLFGEDVGGIVVGGAVLGLAYLLCSPRAQNLSGLLKIAVILCAVAFLLDGAGAVVTKVIDGKASVTSGTWFAAAVLTWFLVHHNSRIAGWVGVRPADEEPAHG